MPLGANQAGDDSPARGVVSGPIGVHPAMSDPLISRASASFALLLRVAFSGVVDLGHSLHMLFRLDRPLWRSLAKGQDTELCVESESASWES